MDDVLKCYPCSGKEIYFSKSILKSVLKIRKYVHKSMTYCIYNKNLIKRHALCSLAILTPKIHECGKESRHNLGLRPYSSPVENHGVEGHNLSSIDHGTFSAKRLSLSLAVPTLG